MGSKQATYMTHQDGCKHVRRPGGRPRWTPGDTHAARMPPFLEGQVGVERLARLGARQQIYRQVFPEQLQLISCTVASSTWRAWAGPP